MLNSSKKLADLLMETGSVTKFVDRQTWVTLAGDLKNIFHKFAIDTKNAEDIGKYSVHLCKVYRQNEPSSRKVKYLARKTGFPGAPDQVTNKYLTVDAEKVIADRAAAFVEDFMNGNGQYDYIRQQDWYRSGEYVIAVDVNYYPDRGGVFKRYPLFHKDTGGNNIFVNLLFDNDSVIEATEWYTDLAVPSQKRIAWQQGLMPKAHLTALTEARGALARKVNPAEPGVVQGGVSDSVFTYVSWVDDLVWHATPIDYARLLLNLETAQWLHSKLSPLVDADDFLSYAYNLYVYGLEIVGTMSEVPGPHLRPWMGANFTRIQDIDEPVARTIWRELYSGADGVRKFTEDAQARLAVDWRITGAVSEATDRDPSLDGGRRINETPVNLSRIRRVNSDPNMLERLKQVQEANKNKTRSFIRTWVRVLPKASTEFTGLQ
jgi:hypothetical protein